MNATDLSASVRAAGVAELVWSDGEATGPQAIGVVPLLLGNSPAVALPWGYEEQARAVAAARSAALVLSEPRLAGASWRPLAVLGRPRLVEDGDGSLFVDRLLDQELRKHPPSRALARSAILRREHWWYLPRLVLLIESPQVVPVAGRQGPLDAVLAVHDRGLHVSTVRVAAWEDDPIEIRHAAPEVSGPAVLVGQEVSEPDAERWTVHVTRGRYADGRFTDVQPAVTRTLEPVPGLRARVRRQRQLERACVKALRAAGHG
jgi:hypothetical protein